MPKYQEITYNEIMGCPLEYGSEVREKLRLGYAHQVQIEAGRLGVLEVQYFHRLSISNLTLTCASCCKTLASYSGVYNHSQKCKGIHPNETADGSLKAAPAPITATHNIQEKGTHPNKVSPTGDKPNWMGDGLGDMENLKTTPVQNPENTTNNTFNPTESEDWSPYSGFANKNYHGVNELSDKVNHGEKYHVQQGAENNYTQDIIANTGSIHRPDDFDNNEAIAINTVKEGGKKGKECNFNCNTNNIHDKNVEKLDHLSTNTTKEQCIKKRLRGGKCGEDNLRQTRSQAKK
jgi:hypothetical protein